MAASPPRTSTSPTAIGATGPNAALYQSPSSNPNISGLPSIPSTSRSANKPKPDQVRRPDGVPRSQVNAGETAMATPATAATALSPTSTDRGLRVIGTSVLTIGSRTEPSRHPRLLVRVPLLSLRSRDDHLTVAHLKTTMQTSRIGRGSSARPVGKTRLLSAG